MPCAIGWKDAAPVDRAVKLSDTIGWTWEDVFIDFSEEIDSDMGLRV
jgi:hypothetical protein